MTPPPPPTPKPGSREKLLDAALGLIREQGYAATSVDALCARAGVSKGAFFHHFDSKEALAVAAAGHWGAKTGAFFASAPYHEASDPLQRVLGYLELRKSLLRGTVAQFTCFAGTMIQEIHGTSPQIRDACRTTIVAHTARIEADLAEAMTLHQVQGDWTAASLALHTQAVLQGAFILAKAEGGAAIAAENIDHLRRYIELLFRPAHKAA